MYQYGLYADAAGMNDFSYVKLYERDPNTGSIGMDITKCKGIKEDFVRDVNQIIKRIDSTPYDIAFFDPNGTQKATYKQEIMKICDRFMDCFNDVCKDFMNYLETESSAIESAREESINALME